MAVSGTVSGTVIETGTDTGTRTSTGLQTRSTSFLWPVASRGEGSQALAPGAYRQGRLVVAQTPDAIWGSQGAEKSEFNELEVPNVSRCFRMVPAGAVARLFGGGARLRLSLQFLTPPLLLWKAKYFLAHP